MKEIVVTESQIREVKGLIAKKAIESWRKLPPRTKCTISIDDMIQDGIWCVTKFLQRGRFNPKKGKLTTILWTKLENYYKRGAEALSTDKRFDGFDQSLEFLKEEKGFDPTEDKEAIEDCEHIREAFLDVYNHASDKLQESMRRWFLSIDQTKIHTRSNRFLKDKREFRGLAQKYNLDIRDCRILIHSTQIQNDVISRLPEHLYIELEF